MSDCNKDEWIAGMWFVVSGMASTLAGIISMLVVAPILFKRS